MVAIYDIGVDFTYTLLFMQIHHMLRSHASVRPPLNKKLFPGYRPTGPKSCEYNSFLHFKILFGSVYILVYSKMRLEEKKS